MGGNCPNVGCLPSKGIISAARKAAAMRDRAELGVTASHVEFSSEAAMEQMRRLRASISRHDSVKCFSELGADVYLGQASFTGNHSRKVSDAELG